MVSYGKLERTDNLLVTTVGDYLMDIEVYYPNILKWYCSKVVPNLNKGFEILVATLKGELVGFSIIETSIKTVHYLYVKKLYRRKRIGTTLMEIVYKELKTTKPCFVVSNLYLDYYLPFVDKLGYKLKSTYRDYYEKDRVEYTFNNKMETFEKHKD